MGPYFVYILRCRGGSLYTGVTDNPARRFRAHCSGSGACAKYTRSHPPQALAALWQCAGRAQACRLENLIKTLPREKKLQLTAAQLTPEAMFAEHLQGEAYLPCALAEFQSIFTEGA